MAMMYLRVKRNVTNDSLNIVEYLEITKGICPIVIP
jgi:hypothetical protein